MLVFVDESGDPGMNLDTGSSEFFVVTAVTVQDDAQAQECISRIVAIRKELRLPDGVEFKFAKSSDSWRRHFLQGIARCSFFYRSIVINKKFLAEQPIVMDKTAFYEYVVTLTIDLWRSYLPGATVDIDESGSGEFSRAFCRNIAKNFKDRQGKPLLKRVRKVNSRNSDMIQLADMVCGAVARSFKRGKKGKEFRELIAFRETEVIQRP